MPDVVRFLTALKKHFGSNNDAGIAASIGVSTSKVSEWRSGKLSVTLKAIGKISAKTGIPQRVLLEWLEPATTQGQRLPQSFAKPPIRLLPRHRKKVSG